MSNYLAIATVTATLQRILQASVQSDVDGARVTTVRPGGSGSGTPETGVNLYLYHVKPVNWRNADLPTRHSQNQLVKRPQIALDLQYLLTFYGNEVEQEPQRLLGNVLRALHARPTLTGDIIRDTIADAALDYLADSNLADQVELITLAPSPMSTDELSKIWSVFFQTPYVLSLAYQAGTVLIESEDIPQRALPVRSTDHRVLPFPPRIDRIICMDAPVYGWRRGQQMIFASSTLSIQGKGLQQESTRIRIGTTELEPASIREAEATIDLGAAPAGSLRAGAQSLQLVTVSGHGNSLRRALESSAVAFILRPLITGLQLDQVAGEGEELRDANLSVTLNPMVGKTQRVVLMLNEVSQREPMAYTFTSDAREADGNQVTVRLQSIRAGTYLVRVQVDGAESLLEVDADPESPTRDQYVRPRMVLP
jgi:Pvc16 N-terminal domain